MLLISEDGIQHYSAIRTLSRLLGSSNTKHKCKQHFFMNCLQGFALESSRDEHQVYCIDNEIIRVEMPSKDLTVEFYDEQSQFKVRFTMYVEFEGILEPIQGLSPDPEEPYTSKVNQHILSGWCVYSKLVYGNVQNPLRLYRGKDCVEKFCDHIKEEVHRLYHMFPEKPIDPPTNGQWTQYKKASKCHICFKPFNCKDPEVRAHCHYTGCCKEPTHRDCNLRYRIPSYIPVIFHNLLGYDAHLFIKELGAKSKDIGVIAKNKEDYITFSVNMVVDRYMDNNGDERDKLIELRFIDSFKFMASSFDSSTNNLVRGGKKLLGFEDYSKNQYELLNKKGIYPYEYLSSWEKFKETQLSPIEAFYSKLNID